MKLLCLLSVLVTVVSWYGDVEGFALPYHTASASMEHHDHLRDSNHHDHDHDLHDHGFDQIELDLLRDEDPMSEPEPEPEFSRVEEEVEGDESEDEDDADVDDGQESEYARRKRHVPDYYGGYHYAQRYGHPNYYSRYPYYPASYYAHGHRGGYRRRWKRSVSNDLSDSDNSLYNSESLAREERKNDVTQESLQQRAKREAGESRSGRGLFGHHRRNRFFGSHRYGNRYYGGYGGYGYPYGGYGGYGSGYYGNGYGGYGYGHRRHRFW